MYTIKALLSLDFLKNSFTLVFRKNIPNLFVCPDGRKSLQPLNKCFVEFLLFSYNFDSISACVLKLKQSGKSI